MQYLTLAGIVLFSFLIAYQDFKSRSISVLYLIGFTVVSFFYGIQQFQWQQTLHYFLFNIFFLALQGSVLILYYYLKYRNFKVLTNSVGGADVWVLIALAFSFDVVNFILFVCVSFICALVCYVFINNVLRKYIKEIPLAGIVVVCYSLFILFVIASNLISRLFS